MRKSLAVFLLAAAAAIQTSSTSFADTFYAATVTGTPGFIADFPFSPSTGANSADATYTGTFFGSAGVGPLGSGPGIVGDSSNTALELNGSTDYVLNSLQGGVSSQGREERQCTNHSRLLYSRRPTLASGCSLQPCFIGDIDFSGG